MAHINRDHKNSKSIVTPTTVIGLPTVDEGLSANEHASINHKQGQECLDGNHRAEQQIKTREAAQREQTKIPKDLASNHGKGAAGQG